MPITGPASYLPTTDEFLGHWEVADTTLGAGNEIVLPGGTNRAGLVTLKTTLLAKRAAVQTKLNVQEVARGDIDIKKTDLLLRINQFNDKVRAMFPGSKWERALAKVPSITDAQGNFTAPLDDAAGLWLMINDDPAIPDLTLLGGYARGTFVTDIAALNTAYTTYNTAGSGVKIAIEERNDVQDEIYDILKKYRQALPTFFAKNHALVESLPPLSPEPGSTPNAVSANGSWDAAAGMAKLTWSASSDPNLDHYEIRFCAGPNYSTENEAVSGSVAPNEPREFLTLDGLAASGNVATFKVYVVTATGNEKGSNTATITRP
jgi:hypothetical protein